jgi:hypothetical protein
MVPRGSIHFENRLQYTQQALNRNFTDNSNAYAIHIFPYVTHAMSVQWKPSSIKCKHGEPDSSVNFANIDGLWILQLQ